MQFENRGLAAKKKNALAVRVSGHWKRVRSSRITSLGRMTSCSWIYLCLSTGYLCKRARARACARTPRTLQTLSLLPRLLTNPRQDYPFIRCIPTLPPPPPSRFGPIFSTLVNVLLTCVPNILYVSIKSHVHRWKNAQLSCTSPQKAFYAKTGELN